jgi:hypothetical protein
VSLPSIARSLLFVLFLTLCPVGVSAHIDTPTLILLKADGPRRFSVRVDADLKLVAGSAEHYYALASRKPAPGDKEVKKIAAKLGDQLTLFAGSEQLILNFRQFIPAVWVKGEPIDSTSVGKRSTFFYEASSPATTAPIRLVTPVGTEIDFPIAFTVQVPDKNISTTRWLVAGMHESDPVDWVMKRQPQENAAISDEEAVPRAFDADRLSWWQQFPTYLQLGFRHIIPEGTDHILFVMGLFFLGLSWRYILSQTTIFTIAHATTLFLATYGIFRLPPQYVEPTIALSIAVIAVENIFRPRLGPGRLAVVFAFGLIHGLGFAASLSDVPFPKNDFVMALLGFNVGVDLGQLLIIAILTLCLGWASKKSWYRGAIAVPASLVIAMVGIIWAIERLYLYRNILLP